MRITETSKSWLIVLYVIQTLILTSCEKIFPGVGGKIVVKIEGVEKKFNYEVVARADYSTTFIHGISYSGDSSRDHPASFSITLLSKPNDLLSGKTYHDVEFDYVFNDIYTAYTWCNNGHFAPIFNSRTVTVTEIDSKHIKGTFSGTIVSDDSRDKPPRLELTDGHFDAEFE